MASVQDGSESSCQTPLDFQSQHHGTQGASEVTDHNRRSLGTENEQRQNNFFLKIKMCWWKGVLKIKGNPESKLFCTRQVHMPNKAFGFSSSPISLKLWIYKAPPPNEPCGHRLKLQRDLSWRVRGRLFWTFEKDKAPEKCYPGRCASAWAQPAIPQVLACLSFFALPAPWSSAPPDYPALYLILLCDDLTLDLYPGFCLSGLLWLQGQRKSTKRSWLLCLHGLCHFKIHNFMLRGKDYLPSFKEKEKSGDLPKVTELLKDERGIKAQVYHSPRPHSFQ